MRRTQGAWAAVLCVAAAGCLDRAGGSRWPARSANGGSPLARSIAPPGRPAKPTSPAGTLYATAILIERPIGDPYLDRELWAAARPAGTEEEQVLLAENGLRAAVLGGNLPSGFQKLVGSEADTVNPHGLTFASRKETVVPTAEPADPCQYAVLADLAGGRARVNLRQARAGVLIHPEATTDGRVQVRCEPQVQHGERRDWLRPTADATGFTIQGEVPRERYPALAFEAVLGPSDYLVIGSPSTAAGTLGAAMFDVEAGGRPRQRVLVLRVARLGDSPGDLPAIPNLRRPSIAAEVSRR